jgi:hypothetical protein
LSLFSRKQYYYLGDGRFSMRQLVNESGNLALTRSYDPFGVVLQEAGSGEALFGFMGAQAGGTQSLLEYHLPGTAAAVSRPAAQGKKRYFRIARHDGRIGLLTSRLLF